ncbi:MAG TPA: ABC transporter ATP-binding protein [Dehalococcoidia bacterium]|nr:ABC transporter ATP-binding protein [Dehalococcoidia bacterium]
MTNDVAIEVRGLTKRYGAFEAVAGIDLRVARGEVFALLGPNGAGKTTTVEILEGYRERSDGEVSVLGFDPGRQERSFKERIGIVLQEPSVEPYLTVEETVRMFGGYYADPLPVDVVLHLVGLTEQRRQRVRRLSGGQQRRLDVAIGLAGNPQLLFLDEPTTGFDPAARREAWEMVRGLQALGKTILLTTHYMEEAEYLADRVAIMRRGVIVAEGAPAELGEQNPHSLIRFRAPEAAGDLLSNIDAATTTAGYVSISTLKPTATLAVLTTRARERGIELPELTVSRPTLEDTYLRLVNEVEAPE